MTKRRDFIRKSVIGTTGLAIGSMGFSCKSSNSTPTLTGEAQTQKDWQSDPEWNRIKYGDWGGPGVPSRPGPMDTILVKDYAPVSSVVTQETFVPKAKFPVIDCHIHVIGKTPEELVDWVKTMDEAGLEKAIVLTSATGEKFDTLADMFLKPYPGRFMLYCGIDSADATKPDFSERVVAELVRCHNKGACGVGEVVDKGSGLAQGLHPDNSLLDGFWRKCAELKMPVSLHVADHPSCWKPLDVYQERSPDYQHFNQYGKDIPSFNEMIAIRNRTLEKHPNTIFIACHLGNMGHDLEKLSIDMDKYPNLYLDTSARDYEFGRTPRSSAKFLTKYKDRIVFGTDQGNSKSMYQIHWRLLETADEYIVGRVGWRYYGLELPAQVLESIYRGTAIKIFNI